MYTKNASHSVLYYYDQGKLVWLGGNIKSEQLLKIANSLPEATSTEFPIGN